jgi:hypothetical protein
MEEASSEGPPDVMPLWLRVTASTVLIGAAAAEMWGPGFAKLKWVVPFCMGFYSFFYVQRQVGEALKMYWRKPPVILSNLLLATGALWAARELFIRFYTR